MTVVNIDPQKIQKQFLMYESFERATNQKAYDEMCERIERTARRRQLITYSELVSGIAFESECYSKPRLIQPWDWNGIDRKMIGSTLAHITAQSVVETGCIASVLVVDKVDNHPSISMFEWMRKMKLLPDTKDHTIMAFWADQVRKAHEFFKKGTFSGMVTA